MSFGLKLNSVGPYLRFFRVRRTPIGPCTIPIGPNYNKIFQLRRTSDGLRRSPKNGFQSPTDSGGLRRTLTKSVSKIHTPKDDRLSPTFLASPIKSGGLRRTPIGLKLFFSDSLKIFRTAQNFFGVLVRRSPSESVGVRCTPTQSDKKLVRRNMNSHRKLLVLPQSVYKISNIYIDI